MVESVREPAPLKSVVLSTREIEAVGRFETWRSSFSAINDVQVPRESEATFSARSEQWRFGSFLLGVNETPARRLVRSRDFCVRDDVDHYAIRLSRRSRGVLHWRGRADKFDYGAISVTSFGEDFVEDRTAGGWISLIFPRDAFPGLTARLDALRSGSLPPSATTALLADYIESLSLRLPKATEDQAPALASMTCAMLMGCIAAEEAPSHGRGGAGDLVKRARVERVIRRNIGSARLDVERICTLAAVSRSVLYRVFESEGGIATYVRRLRLRLVAEDLGNPDLADETIAALAERRGFHCAASFSRSFKEAFGHSPREAREAAALGFRHDGSKRRGRARQAPRSAPMSPTPSLLDILP